MGNALLDMYSLYLRPFDPESDAPRDVGLGWPSTEYLMTEEAPDGGFWNIPSVWWRDGEAFRLSPEQAMEMALRYEQVTGKKFPRFDDSGAGSFSAMNRSAMGGAMNNPLAGYLHGRNRN